MELIDIYVDLCKRLGGCSDWVQGAGGNISVKSGDDLIVKASGARIGDTTRDSGYVICSISALQTLITSGTEDSSSALKAGSGKPSIEAFFHIVPARIVVHLHPSHLLTQLCAARAARSHASMIPYVKPGLQLADAFFAVYKPSTRLYFLQNHGIIVCGETVEEVMTVLESIQGWSNLSIVNALYNCVYKNTGKQPIVKSFKATTPSKLVPYTPDMAVFLQTPLFSSPASILSDLDTYFDTYKTTPNIVCSEGVTYIVAPSLSKCYDIYEILMAYNEVEAGEPLSPQDVRELTSWDKEISRKAN
jgi:ribulose-5-phosphate 4-epimerase/fuculose-1-phosphate aldolase